MDAGQHRLDWCLKTLFTLSGHVVLRIPQVEVARAALEVDEDDALGLAEAGAALGLVVVGSAAAAFWSANIWARRDAEDAGTADAQEIAAGDAVAGVACWPHRE